MLATDAFLSSRCDAGLFSLPAADVDPQRVVIANGAMLNLLFILNTLHDGWRLTLVRAAISSMRPCRSHVSSRAVSKPPHAGIDPLNSETSRAVGARMI